MSHSIYLIRILFLVFTFAPLLLVGEVDGFPDLDGLFLRGRAVIMDGRSFRRHQWLLMISNPSLVSYRSIAQTFKQWLAPLICHISASFNPYTCSQSRKQWKHNQKSESITTAVNIYYTLLYRWYLTFLYSSWSLSFLIIFAAPDSTSLKKSLPFADSFLLSNCDSFITYKQSMSFRYPITDQHCKSYLWDVMI